MDEHIRQFFGDEVSIDTIDRRDIIQALIVRHSRQIEPLKEEIASLKKEMESLETEVKSTRSRRDEVNTRVMDLKQTRRVLHELANEKRREFFLLIEKLDDLEKIDHEIDDFNSRLDKLEWEIQTTRITASDEKVLIKSMREIYSRLTEANVEAQKKLGIEERVRSLSREIGENLAGAQSRHEELLTLAAASDVHHDEFLAKNSHFSELRIRLRRAERRIATHRESLEYWKGWVEGQ